MTWPGVKDIPAQVLKEGKPSIRDIREDCLTPEKYPRSVVALEFGLRTLIQLPIVVDDRVEAILEFASDEELASDHEFAEALTSAAERIARFFERRRAQILFVKNRQELETSARLAKLVRDVARVSSTATTMRDALQQSIDVICETLGFPVGHALLIEDDEPNLIKSSHVVYVQDMQRFAGLFSVTTQLKWPADFGSRGEVLRSGKPVIHDMTISHNDPQLYPRAAPCLAAGLRTALHLPVLVNGNVEAIVEFASEEDISQDREIADALVAATERISRFFERRRAQILLLRKKEELEASAERLFTAAGRLVDSQEEERRRIAREIHDDFTQRLALVSMKIGSLTGQDRSSTPEELDAGLEEIRKATAAVASDLRDLSHQLHPAMLGLLGLVRALQAQCEEFQRICGIQTTFESSISDADASSQTATCLYRVLQEALMNLAKHSGSKVARVSLNRIGTELVMQIRDEGHGFPRDAAGLKGIGLLNMRERVQFLNGTLTVNSSPGNGAEILIRVPALPAV